MFLYKKYKTALFLNLEDSLEFSLKIENNIHKINSYFKHSKRLIRALLLVHFYIYATQPFVPLLYRGSAREYIVLTTNTLILVSSDCYKSYFK